jgi:GT2 family glycosyltransferase
VLTLNPDAILLPEFLAQLVEAGRADSAAGTICGRLLSISPNLRTPDQRRIDSTGIYFTPELRHFDRGWSEPDDGRFQEMEYVFGASAAAALYRRTMIDDISVDGEFFDPAFFAYREDADIAWRAQLLGWRCLYVPSATAYHVRTVVATNRRSVPAVLNMHSVKNRFLMRIKNMSGRLYLRYWLPITVRDVLVIGGCVFSEQTSLPAFWHLAKGVRRALSHRRAIMRRRRASDEAIAAWFSADAPITALSQPPVAAPAMRTEAGT